MNLINFSTILNRRITLYDTKGTFKIQFFTSALSLKEAQIVMLFSRVATNSEHTVLRSGRWYKYGWWYASKEETCQAIYDVPAN